MYTYLRTLGLSTFALREAPACVMSFLIAELFYKFHSFTLECLAFLGTWYSLSWLQSALLGQRDDR
jgi:hypothetical protein